MFVIGERLFCRWLTMIQASTASFVVRYQTNAKEGQFPKIVLQSLNALQNYSKWSNALHERDEVRLLRPLELANDSPASSTKFGLLHNPALSFKLSSMLGQTSLPNFFNSAAPGLTPLHWPLLIGVAKRGIVFRDCLKANASRGA